MDKIRVGVVGAGYFGQFHAEKYSKMEGVELVGVVDIDPSRVREIAKRYQTQPFLRHSDLFGKIQAVSIAVPTPFHHCVTKDFFLCGIDVLLEKPISSTLEEADELIGLADSKGLILQVGHLERFNGALSAVVPIIRNPWFIESQRSGPFSGRAADVNVVIDLMIHDIDVLLSLVPSNIKQVEACGMSLLTPHLDMANARIEFENGCVAHLTASRISREKVRTTHIFQPDEILCVDFLSQRVSFSQRGSRAGGKDIPELVREEIPVQKVDLLEAEIHSFLRCVRDRKDPRISGRDGRKALEVALQIIQKIERSTEKAKS